MAAGFHSVGGVVETTPVVERCSPGLTEKKGPVEKMARPLSRQGICRASKRDDSSRWHSGTTHSEWHLDLYIGTTTKTRLTESAAAAAELDLLRETRVLDEVAPAVTVLI